MGLSSSEKHYVRPFHFRPGMKCTTSGNIGQPYQYKPDQHGDTITFSSRSSRIKEQEEKQPSASPYIDLAMLLRYTAHAAVGVSCLLVMVAYQPVKACTCLEVTDEEKFCMAENLVKLTVLRVTIVQEGNVSCCSGYVLHHVHIDKVFKSMKSVAARKKLYLRTLQYDGFCGLLLTVGRQYLVSASMDRGHLFTDSCNWVKEWASVNPNAMKLLNGVVKPKCT